MKFKVPHNSENWLLLSINLGQNNPSQNKWVTLHSRTSCLITLGSQATLSRILDWELVFWGKHGRENSGTVYRDAMPGKHQGLPCNSWTPSKVWGMQLQVRETPGEARKHGMSSNEVACPSIKGLTSPPSFFLGLFPWLMRAHKQRSATQIGAWQFTGKEQAWKNWSWERTRNVIESQKKRLQMVDPAGQDKCCLLLEPTGWRSSKGGTKSLFLPV